ALRAYTIANAYGAFMEDELGTLEPGKRGDLVVLSENILQIEPARSADVNVDFTVIGGVVAHEREQQLAERYSRPAANLLPGAARSPALDDQRHRVGARPPLTDAAMDTRGPRPRRGAAGPCYAARRSACPALATPHPACSTAQVPLPRRHLHRPTVRP